MVRTCLLLLCGSLLFGASSDGVSPQDPADPPVDFARQVRPILGENCFRCHGPDDAAREAELRLDTREGMFDRGGYAAV